MSPGSKKDEIIKTSIEIFVNEGFDRPTMDSIAAQNNVSKRTLYKHFPNKRALLFEILNYLIEQNQNALSFQFSANENIQDQLEHIISEKVRLLLCTNNMKLSKIILSEYLKDQGLLRDHIENVLKTERSTIKWIKEAQEHQMLSDQLSSRKLLERLNELIHGLIFFPILFGRKSAFDIGDIPLVRTMYLAAFGK